MHAATRYGSLAATIALGSCAAYAQDAAHDAPAAHDHTAALVTSPAAPHREFRASELIGANVQSAAGENLAVIDDLVLSASDEVVSVVLSVGGLFGIGDKLVAVPYHDLGVSPSGTLYVSMTAEQLASAPEFAATTTELAVASSADDGEPLAGYQPDRQAQSEATAEAEEIYAEDDPRVAAGIADNKGAYEGKATETTPPAP